MDASKDRNHRINLNIVLHGDGDEDVDFGGNEAVEGIDLNTVNLCMASLLFGINFRALPLLETP